MPDFCEASATNGNGSQGANFTAGGCELSANQSREAGDSVWDTERHFGILAIARLRTDPGSVDPVRLTRFG